MIRIITDDYCRRCTIFPGFVLEQLQALVVQVEAGVAREVELLKLLGKRLGQSDLGQLVAAQVDTLRERRTESQRFDMQVVREVGGV